MKVVKRGQPSVLSRVFENDKTLDRRE